ncbi:MAG TPA: hypothetical protein DEB39_11725 [Planctomycetaceae bacterium]|nr:hypothetical protein [Planctomycetaceae bacterium]
MKTSGIKAGKEWGGIDNGQLTIDNEDTQFKRCGQEFACVPRCPLSIVNSTAFIPASMLVDETTGLIRLRYKRKTQPASVSMTNQQKRER